MRTCSKCGEHPAKTGQSYCKDCHATYMREWRATHKLSPEERAKDTCRSYTNVLIRRGHLKRGVCIWCDSKRSEAHHPDYSRPRLVIWLCRRHHLDLHEMIDAAHWFDRMPGVDVPRGTLPNSHESEVAV